MKLSQQQYYSLLFSLGVALAASGVSINGGTSWMPTSTRAINLKYATPVSMSSDVSDWMWSGLTVSWLVIQVMFAAGQDLGFGDDTYQQKLVSKLVACNALFTGYFVAQCNDMIVVASLFQTAAMVTLGHMAMDLQAMAEGTPLLPFDRLVLYTISAHHSMLMLTLPTQYTQALDLCDMVSYGTLAVAVIGTCGMAVRYRDPAAGLITAGALYSMYYQRMLCGDILLLENNGSVDSEATDYAWYKAYFPGNSQGADVSFFDSKSFDF
jgi:hypothetical protein